MVVHMQTKHDNWNFSSAKFETFVTLFESRPHIQIISTWQTIMRKLNKNHNNRLLTHINFIYRYQDERTVQEDWSLASSFRSMFYACCHTMKHLYTKKYLNFSTHFVQNAPQKFCRLLKDVVRGVVVCKLDYGAQGPDMILPSGLVPD